MHRCKLHLHSTNTQCISLDLNDVCVCMHVCNNMRNVSTHYMSRSHLLHHHAWWCFYYWVCAGLSGAAGTAPRNQTPVNIHLSKQIQTPRLKSENDICKVWLATHRHDRPVKMRRLPVFSWRSKRDQPKISRFRVPFGILAQLVRPPPR